MNASCSQWLPVFVSLLGTLRIYKKQLSNCSKRCISRHIIYLAPRMGQVRSIILTAQEKSPYQPEDRISQK